MLIVDFETKSRVNLQDAGAYNYAQDTSTDILCAAFTFKDPEDDREWLWVPDEAFPPELFKLITDNDFLLAAHNAAFDRLIWECIAVDQYGFPEVAFDRWYCTSAQMRVNGLPASLEDAARALNTSYQKNYRGKALIRKLSVPDVKTGEFCTDSELLEEMYDYCIDDIRTTKSIINATRLMLQREHDDWLNNEDINERGVMVDIQLAKAAQLYANDEYIELAEELSRASHGAITKHTQTVRAAKWVSDQIGDDHPAHRYMIKYVDNEPKLTLDKGARETLLDKHELNEIELPADVLDVITALHEGSKSSVTKFKRMLHRADPYSKRVHGAFIYGGASQTMRFSSQGLQLHNFPSRGLFKTMDEAWAMYDLMMQGKTINADMPTMEALKKMLRHAIMPKDDHWLVIGDWSGIEARVLPWLANSDGGDAKLDLIEDIDEAIRAGEKPKDLYLITAESIGHEGFRDLGKVMELACGYEGGVNAFKQFAKSYNVLIPDHQIKELIRAWRSVNLWVVEFWRDLEKAAIQAVRTPEYTTQAGMIKYRYLPNLIDGTLLCILPDETLLQFPRCRIEYDRNDRPFLTALKSSVKMKADDAEWPRESLYGGRFAAIATQGTAAALMRDLISRVDNTVAHVHDEIICEVHENKADDAAAALRVEMETPPEWAQGLPLMAEPEVTERFKK